MDIVQGVFKETEEIMTRKLGEIKEKQRVELEELKKALETQEVEVKTRMLKGFEIKVPDDSKKKRIEDKISGTKSRMNITNELLKMPSMFARVLKEKGFEAIAVLPYGIWSELTRRSNIFKFEDIGNNSWVDISVDFLEEIKEKIKTILVLFFLAGIVIVSGLFVNGFLPFLTIAAIVAGCIRYISGTAGEYASEWLTKISQLAFIGLLIGHILPHTYVSWISLAGSSFENRIIYPVLLVCGVVLGYFSLLGADKLLRKVMEKPCQPLAALVAATFSRNKLIDKFWPDRIDHISSSHKSRIKIRFPEANKKFIEILHKTEGKDLNIGIGAVPEAITFSDFDGGVAVRITGIFKVFREKETRPNACPILYCKEKNDHYFERSAVAILAQTGDFPAEKEMIESIKRIDFARCLNLN